MYRTKILPLLALGLTISALVANVFIQTGAMRRLARRDVSAFPRTLADWIGGEDRPLDPKTQQLLATADVVDRVYTSPSGQMINFLLVSSTDPEDAHSPESCLPSQGWTLRSVQNETLDGQAIHTDKATRSGQSLDVVFWFDILNDKNASLFSRMEAVRESVRGQGSLMVRLTTPSGPDSDRTLREFARLVIPAMRVWKKQAPILKSP